MTTLDGFEIVVGIKRKTSLTPGVFKQKKNNSCNIYGEAGSNKPHRLRYPIGIQ